MKPAGGTCHRGLVFGAIRRAGGTVNGALLGAAVIATIANRTRPADSRR